MKFLKFWWEHSLRVVLLILLAFLGWAWVSGYIHWWAYKTFANENHWEALMATCLIWMGIVVVLGAAIAFVIAPAFTYFSDLWAEYQKQVSRDSQNR